MGAGYRLPWGRVGAGAPLIGTDRRAQPTSRGAPTVLLHAGELTYDSEVDALCTVAVGTHRSGTGAVR